MNVFLANKGESWYTCKGKKDEELHGGSKRFLSCLMPLLIFAAVLRDLQALVHLCPVFLLNSVLMDLFILTLVTEAAFVPFQYRTLSSPMFMQCTLHPCIGLCPVPLFRIVLQTCDSIALHRHHKWLFS